MRDYAGVPVHEVKDAAERINIIGPIDYFLRDLSRAMGRIQKGQVPNGSGDTIINVGPLSDIYLVLLGRDGNQIAHGGTRAAGTLTLASTRHSTKGKVYLGNAQQTAYDEVNERIGIATAGPAARLHIKVPDPVGVTAYITSAAAGNVDWGVFGTTSYVTALSDNSDSTYAEWNPVFGIGSTLSTNLTSGLTDPGVTAGFRINIRARSTHSAGNSGVHFVFKNQSGGGQWRDIHLTSPNSTAASDAQMTTSYQNFSFAYTTADTPTAVNFASQPLRCDWAFAGVAAGTGVIDIAEFGFGLPPAGGGSAETLQRWESASNQNNLDYGQDGNANQSLILSGKRFAVSASAFAITEGTPSSGAVLASTDAIGTVAWASASSLATLLEHRFVANGPYKIDNDVDGAWIPARAGTLSSVRFYRRLGGSSGSTAVELLKNGTTVFSAPPNIAASAGASATASGTISVTTFAANDRFTASASAVDVGRPQDWVLAVRAY